MLPGPHDPYLRSKELEQHVNLRGFEGSYPGGLINIVCGNDNLWTYMMPNL